MSSVKPKIVNGKNQLFASNFGTDMSFPVLLNSAEFVEIEVPEFTYNPEVYNAGFDTASFESLQKFVNDCVNTLSDNFVAYKKRKMLAFYCFSSANTETKTETGTLDNPFTSLETAFSYIECLLQKTCYCFDVVLYVSGKHELTERQSRQSHQFNRRLFVTPYKSEDVSLIFNDPSYLHGISFLDCKDIKYVRQSNNSWGIAFTIYKLVNSNIYTGGKYEVNLGVGIDEAYYSSVSGNPGYRATCYLSTTVESIFADIHIDDYLAVGLPYFRLSTFTDVTCIYHRLFADTCTFNNCQVAGNGVGNAIALECTFKNDSTPSELCMYKCAFKSAIRCYIERCIFTHQGLNNSYHGIVNCTVAVKQGVYDSGVEVVGSVKNSVFIYDKGEEGYHDRHIAFSATGYTYNDAVIENNTFKGTIAVTHYSYLFSFDHLNLKNNKADFQCKPYNEYEGATSVYIKPFYDYTDAAFIDDFTINIKIDDMKAQSNHDLSLALFGVPVTYSKNAKVNYSYNISSSSGLENYSVVVYEFSRGGVLNDHCNVECGTVGKYTHDSEEDGYFTNVSGSWDGRTYTDTGRYGKSETGTVLDEFNTTCSLCD